MYMLSDFIYMRYFTMQRQSLFVEFAVEQVLVDLELAKVLAVAYEERIDHRSDSIRISDILPNKRIPVTMVIVCVHSSSNERHDVSLVHE